MLRVKKYCVLSKRIKRNISADVVRLLLSEKDCPPELGEGDECVWASVCTFVCVCVCVCPRPSQCETERERQDERPGVHVCVYVSPSPLHHTQMCVSLSLSLASSHHA